MSEDLVKQVTDEVSRVGQLPIDEQPAAFSALRDLLESELNSAPKTPDN